MRTRVLSPVLIAAALAFGVVACGSDDAGQTSSGGTATLPPTSPGSEHPTGADEVVISYAEVGGFVPREVAFQQTPTLLVSGDGQAISPGAQIAIYPAPLLPALQTRTITEEGIQAILTAADEAGLLADIEYDEPTNIADASTARVVISANGETYVHEAYALGLAPIDGEETSPERQALAAFIAQLNDLETLVGADQLGAQELLEPTAFGIEALVVDDLSAYENDGIEPTMVDWPADASVRLADASTCTTVPAAEVDAVFAEANQLTFFDDAGVTYQVLVRPILPGDECA